jgi:chitinase
MFFRDALIAGGLLATLINGFPASTNTARAAPDGKRLTVYWGAEDNSLSLASVCADDSYDIVNLAFLAYFHGPGGYPTLSIQGLYDQTAAQTAAGATGLTDGSSLVSTIETCQAAGKLVLLSMGGAQGYADVTLSSDEDAQTIANQVWNLFLGGTDDSDLRPFGSLKLDGVDLGM